jgi:hypothetical protein
MKSKKNDKCLFQQSRTPANRNTEKCNPPLTPPRRGRIHGGNGH